MPARAIIDLPEIPESCSGCPYQKQKDIFKRNVFYCEIEEDCYSTYEHEYSRHKNCPLRKVPEWTEEDTITLHAMIKVLQRSYQLWTKYDIKEPDAGNVLKRQEMLLKLCKLARVEVAE